MLEAVVYAKLLALSVIAAIVLLPLSSLYIAALLRIDRLKAGPLRNAMAQLAFLAFALVVTLPLMLALLVERIRLFSRSGTIPLIFVLVCFGIAVAPALWNLRVRHARLLESRGYFRK